MRTKHLEHIQMFVLALSNSTVMFPFPKGRSVHHDPDIVPPATDVAVKTQSVWWSCTDDLIRFSLIVRVDGREMACHIIYPEENFVDAIDQYLNSNKRLFKFESSYFTVLMM